MSIQRLVDAGVSSPALVTALYEQYLADPQSVHPTLQREFELMPAGAPAPTQIPAGGGGADGALRVYRLLEAYRTYGHLMAQVNPVATEEPREPRELNLEALGFKQEELGKSFPTCGLLPQTEATLQEIVTALKTTYCGRMGVEYMGMHSHELEEWMQQQLEPVQSKPKLDIEQKKMILTQLNRSELMEVFLHTKYTGQKRFSLEGTETLIPILEAMIESGATFGMEEIVIGMAHRGRLNVLANTLQKSYNSIFAEFEEGFIPNSFEGSGDVKYHKGFTVQRTVATGSKVTVSLPANPSHLEAVDGVVEGQVRARQVLLGDDKTQQRVIPVLIHGDAAVSGQGIVYEVMQMSKLPGYGNGGTLHIVINNQIGFTTLPKDSRSTAYCTDIARAFSSPVFHVNAEDPESCILAAILSVQLRQKFGCDVFIDLQGYRKYGHNEGDEPAFTQPLEYQQIRKKRPIRELYRDELIQQGVMERQMAEGLEAEFKASLQSALDSGSGQGKTAEEHRMHKEERQAATRASLFSPVDTAVPADILRRLTESFCTVPEGFEVNRKLARLLEQRRQMVQQEPDVACIDWGMGEHLAFASLLDEGRHVRLSGQDSRRGTFSHRHAMWVDQKAQKKFFPLSKMPGSKGRFDVFNSPLSEYGVMGFEYGYSLAYPQALVMWEAQFGDFCNGAQIIIDQFISTSEQKWGNPCRLVLLLPHGMEGQGPEHSSARMERFLTLAGDNNMMVVNPSTPAQFFHLLRRQVHAPYQKPLIVFTPKGLLRLPQCQSSMAELSEGRFQTLLDDPEPPKKAKTLVFCSGRVFYDMLAERKQRGIEDMAIVRLEQLYPFDEDAAQSYLKKYAGFKRCIWLQEEPRNMGAWNHVKPFLRLLLPKSVELEYVGRARSASPATGSPAVHKQELQAITEALFGKQKEKAHV